MNEQNFTISVPESINPLAALAMREAGAQGYAIFRNEAGGAVTRIGGGGVAIPAPAGTQGAIDARVCVVSFPVRPGLIAFAFEGRVPTAAARTRLARMAAAIGQLWQLPETAHDLSAKAARIARLEASLADAKIASRAQGFLSEAGSGRDVVETVTRHVQTVLGRSESVALLDRRLAELEAELRERDLTVAAKALLQADGLSEDAAHQRLRLLSRKTRRPLREIAMEVIATSRGRPAPGPEHPA